VKRRSWVGSRLLRRPKLFAHSTRRNDIWSRKAWKRLEHDVPELLYDCLGCLLHRHPCQSNLPNCKVKLSLQNTIGRSVKAISPRLRIRAGRGQAIIVICRIGISVVMGGVGGPPAEIEFAGSHRIFLESLVGAGPDMDIMD
jgi:hypothetical protein